MNRWLHFQSSRKIASITAMHSRKQICVQAEVVGGIGKLLTGLQVAHLGGKVESPCHACLTLWVCVLPILAQKVLNNLAALRTALGNIVDAT